MLLSGAIFIGSYVYQTVVARQKSFLGSWTAADYHAVQFSGRIFEPLALDRRREVGCRVG